MISTETNQLKELLDRKVQLLEEILTCTRILTGISCKEKPTQYQNLIETREQCINGLKQLESSLQARVGSDKVKMNDDPQIAILNERVPGLLREIVQLDQKNIAAVSKDKQEIETKLTGVRKGRKGITQYETGWQVNTGGAFTDSRR